MNNPFTQAEELEYQQVMHERWQVEQQQRREDAMDAYDEEDGK
jgi:hypothetical protein